MICHYLSYILLCDPQYYSKEVTSCKKSSHIFSTKYCIFTQQTARNLSFFWPHKITRTTSMEFPVSLIS